jgi:hypothetical protein
MSVHPTLSSTRNIGTETTQDLNTLGGRAKTAAIANATAS